VETRLLGSGAGEDRRFRVVLGLVAGPVVGFELGLRDQADLAVEPAVVAPVDVLGDGDLDLTDFQPGSRSPECHRGIRSTVR
jgi:hypothetical protein